MSLSPGRPVVGVLLAAGAGRRLGRGPKALLSLENPLSLENQQGGRPLVATSATALLRGGCDEVVVVVGASGERVREALDRALAGTPEQGRCRVVVNPHWETGMGSSFRAGIAAADRILSAPESPAAPAAPEALTAPGAPAAPDGVVVLALVDQPDIGAAVVAHLLRAAAGPGTAAGQTAGRRVTAAGFPDGQGRLVRGHPLVFPLHLAREAAAVAAGDAAGRVWLRAHPEAVEVLDVSHLATGRDLDTPADLHRWTRLETAEGSRGVRT